MDQSPYSPGAGTLPPVLAGRDRLLHRLMLGLNDVATVGRVRTQDVILIGPRGVGKTVAMSVYGDQARSGGFEVINQQRLTVDHRGAAVVFAGTGLPHTPDVLRTSRVTHPDRLFLLEELPVSLSRDDALYAIIEPARQRGVRWEPQAADEIVDSSNGYPAHMQMFAHEAWLAAAGPGLITLAEARAGLVQAHDDLARRTLGPRWRAMPERQMEYIAALALHGGSSTTGTVARTLGRTAQELSKVRDTLISEGDLYSLQRGHIALAVPIFGFYALAEYERARQMATLDLISLDQMRSNAGAITSTTPLALEPGDTPLDQP